MLDFLFFCKEHLTKQKNRDMIILVKSDDGKSIRVQDCQRKGKLRCDFLAVPGSVKTTPELSAMSSTEFSLRK